MAAYEEFFSRFQAQKPEDAEIAAMAGFSLGEYAALTAAGVISVSYTHLDVYKRQDFRKSEKSCSVKA